MSLKEDEKTLRGILARLSESERRTLLDFGRFLAERADAPDAVAGPSLPEPAPLPRPPDETVIGAMKRLSKTYPMVDKSKVLNESSALMAQHVMQGRDAEEVIAELEALFESHYRRLREDQP
jgi:hypothetical protein